jgi:rubrerythrin
MENKKIISLTITLVLILTIVPLISIPTFAQADKSKTYDNLYASVQGETNAAAAYHAFANKAENEGYPAIANLFRATADAETRHADDEWAILQSMGATECPIATTPTVETTAKNLQTAIDGETFEYTSMYTEFLETAQNEENTAATRIFKLAMKAEEVHAGNYKDALNNLQDANYLNEKYSEVYRCVTCGEVVTALPNKCPICGALGETFVTYNAKEKNTLSNNAIIILITAIVVMALAAAIILTKKRNN